jgi:hypothetical protein
LQFQFVSTKGTNSFSVLGKHTPCNKVK